MSNPLRKMFETDKSVEIEGIVVEYAPGVEIKIARAGGGNKKFAKTMSRLAKPHRRAIQTDAIAEETLNHLFIKAYAATIILGWKGLTKDLITHKEEDAKVELTFNLENAEALLTEQPNLFTDIQRTADNIALFRAEINEADSGN